MRLLVLATALVALPASAQLSFSADDYTPTAFGSSLTTALEGSATVYSTDGSGVSDADAVRIDALIDKTGAGQTWDFAALTFLDQTLSIEGRRVDDPTALPGADLFPSATVAYVSNFRGFTGPSDVTYTFARVSADAFVTLGSYIEDAGAGQPFRNQYVPDGLVHATFPLTLGTSFEDDSEFDQSPRAAAGPNAVRVAVSVVGSGTLVLPSGRYECLMVRRQVTEEERGGGQTTGVFTTVVYEWVTADQVAAQASRNEVVPGRPIRVAQYYEPRIVTDLEDAPRLTSLIVAPNPTASTSSVRFSVLEAAAARVTVFDALGREVAVLHDGPLRAGDHAFPTSILTPGVYVVRVEAEGRVGTVRFVVAR